MHFLFPAVGTSFHEHRLMYFADASKSGGMANIPKSGSEPLDATEYLNWKRGTPGVDALLKAFDERTDVTFEEVIKYAEDLERENSKKMDPPKKPLTAFEQELIHTVKLVKPDNNIEPSRLEAENTLMNMVSFVNKRNEYLDEAQQSRKRLHESEVLPGFTGMVLDTGKKAISLTIEPFRAATGKEKMVMLAGLATGILAVRYVASLLPKGTSVMKKLMWSAFGLSATYMALETWNRTTKEVTGSSLMEMVKGDQFRTPEGLQKVRQERELDEVYKQVAGHTIPVHVIDALDIPEENKHYILGIDALSNLSVEQFLRLYEISKTHQRIPDNDPIYGLNADEDFLTPFKRFILVREIGETMGFICKKDGKVINRPQKPQSQQLLLRLMNDIPQEEEFQPETPPLLEEVEYPVEEDVSNGETPPDEVEISGEETTEEAVVDDGEMPPEEVSEEQVGENIPPPTQFKGI